MNRRSFLTNLALSFTILPSAGRVWKAVVNPRNIPNPAYVNATFECFIFTSAPSFQWLPSFQDFIRTKEDLERFALDEKEWAKTRKRLYVDSGRTWRPNREIGATQSQDTLLPTLQRDSIAAPQRVEPDIRKAKNLRSYLRAIVAKSK